MEEFDHKQDPHTLYVAPNCGIQLDYHINICNKGFGHVYKITNISKFQNVCTAAVHSDDECKQGWIAPLRPLTLNDDEKIKIGVPPYAKKFSYVFPPQKLSDCIDWNRVESPDKCVESFRFHINPTEKSYREAAANERPWAFPHFATFGAYAYFNDNDELLRVNAITLEETRYKLYFKGPYIATPNTFHEVRDWNRYEPFYLDSFREIGYAGCSWVDAHDHRYIDKNVTGQEMVINDHGGFIVFRHDKSAIIFLVAGVHYSMMDRQIGVGGLFRDAISLFKEQKESMVTTSLFDPHRKSICQVSKDEVLAYLEDRSDQPINDPFLSTKLHHACCFFPRDVRTISEIIQRDHNAVTTKDKTDLYPLHIALQNNASVEVVKLLLESDKQNITLNSKSKHHGLLPIHMACGNNATSIDVIKLLLEKDERKATLRGNSTLGYNCLHRALSAKHDFEVINLIYNAYKSAEVPREVTVDGMSLLHVACVKGCPVKVVELLLDNDFADESFHEVISSNNSYGEESDLTGCNVLHLALEHSTQEVVDALIMKEVRLRCTFNDFMKASCNKVMTDSCSRTLFHGSNGGHMLPIHIACKKNFGLDTIQKLLRFHPLSVFIQDIYGNTPLHYACMNPEVDESMIQLLLETEKEARDETHRSAAFVTNKYYETPLFLAINSGAAGAHALLMPEHICLRKLNSKTTKKSILAKDALIEWVLMEPNGRQFQDCIVQCLAERHYFALIMWELIAHIVAIVVFFLASMRTLKDSGSIHPVESLTLIGCLIIFATNELIQFNGSKASDYLLDVWNWIDSASIVVLSMAIFHMIELREAPYLEPNKLLFIWSWVLLLLQLVIVIRSTFFPFSRFVAGVINIIFALNPFAVLSVLSLLVFTYAFHTFGKDQCTSFAACFLWTLEGFVFGFEDFLTGTVTPFTDALYGVLAVIVLLNLVIAIVSNAWDASKEKAKKVYWISRVELLFQYRYFTKMRNKDHLTFGWLNNFLCIFYGTFRPLFDYIDDDERFDFNNNHWKNIQELPIFIICFLLGLPTLGVFWPKSLRRAILSTGMVINGESVENIDKDIKIKQLEEEKERLIRERINLESDFRREKDILMRENLEMKFMKKNSWI